MKKTFMTLAILWLAAVCFTGCTKMTVQEYTVDNCNEMIVDSVYYDTLSVPTISTDDLNDIIEFSLKYMNMKEHYGKPAMSEKIGDTLAVWCGLAHSSGNRMKNEGNTMEKVQPTKWARITFIGDTFMEARVLNTNYYDMPLVTYDRHIKKTFKNMCAPYVAQKRVEELDTMKTASLVLSTAAVITGLIILVTND